MATKQLPSKESALFRSIVKCYEVKQYKKGLKAADQILRKHPEHGETLAMKGLTLNCLDRKEEAYELVKLGLRHDLKSHVCWHVFGLLYRSDRNYAEATKCYRNALRIDPENLQILRDLYLLQIQRRDLKGFAETRRSLLTLKPNNRNNWIGFAIAHHLLGNYKMAVDILEKYLGTLEKGREANYEDSEVYLYANQIIEESGEYSRALQHLEDHKPMITDTLAYRIKKATFLLHLNRSDEAKEVIDELLDINFDNYEVHRLVQAYLVGKPELLASGTTGRTLPSSSINESEDVSKLLEFYDNARESLESAKAVPSLRLSLDFTSGEAFNERLELFLKRQLTFGIPSLGSDIKALYQDKDKASQIEKTLLSFLSTLESKKLIWETTSSKSLNPDKVLLWANYLAAQHFDRVQQQDKALSYIEKCIEQDPNELDFVQRKGRILKHQGKLSEAAEVVDKARKLDLADRYINNKTTKYLLKADETSRAEETIALFTKHEGDPQQNIVDMQCLWYELADGQSHLRQQQYGLALKRFATIEKHFSDFVEDQFDFHTYCIRKLTLRAYVQLLRHIDSIYGYAFFVDAALGAVQAYLELSAAPEDKVNGTVKPQMSAAEKKKQKREKAKARKAEFKRKAEGTTEQPVKNGKKSKDEDPNGEELVKKPAMEEAWRYVTILQEYAPNDVRTHVAAFDVAKRKNKVLLCLQALIRAQKCEKNEEMDKKLADRRKVLDDMVLSVEDATVKQVVETKIKEL